MEKEQKQQKQSRYPWERAPEWAKYAATDLSGACYWFECEPVCKTRYWYPVCKTRYWYGETGMCAKIEDSGTDWKQSLETRPDNI